jgi:hypothetical protein
VVNCWLQKISAQNNIKSNLEELEFTPHIFYHHVLIPIPLSKVDQVTDRAMEKIKAYTNNVCQESMMYYHEDNRYSDTKKAEGCARLITDHNWSKLFVINEFEKSIKYLQENLKSLTQVLPDSSTRI